jgi:hypothetical protein
MATRFAFKLQLKLDIPDQEILCQRDRKNPYKENSGTSILALMQIILVKFWAVSRYFGEPGINHAGITSFNCSTCV